MVSVKLAPVRGRYDAATTTDENRRHWSAADGLSANAANQSGVRRVLRNRARYEVANNSYARGIVLTLANDTIGTGPRLQLTSEDSAANAILEDAFDRWADAVDLADKLRTLRMARAESGECFLLLVSNPNIDSPVKLDLRLVEADQVATPLQATLNGKEPGNQTDGIVYDKHGNPTAYHILKNHPGDRAGGGGGGDSLLPLRASGSMPRYP